MEVEPRIAKQYKCQYCCSCKNYRGKGMEGGKKVSASFFGWPEDRDFIAKMRFWASYSTSNKLLLIARHIMTAGLKKCLQSWQCKIHCQCLSLWRKYAPEVKAAKGLEWCQAKVKGDNIPPPPPPESPNNLGACTFEEEKPTDRNQKWLTNEMRKTKDWRTNRFCTKILKINAEYSALKRVA